MARRQPSTIKTQRVTKRDTRQETKNQANAEKKNPQKFNTGINLEAVFGAITQLLETFTNQVLDRNSVNMSLLLRTVYRNLDDDMVDILMEPQNVEYLNKLLEGKNKEVAEALAGKSQTTGQSEHLTTTVTNVEKITDTVIQKAPEVKVVPPEIITKPIEVERTEKLPDVVEKEQVTEKTETLPEEVRTVPSTLQNVSPSQRAFAAGEITSDDNVDILELAQDFINELQSSAWKLQQTTGAMAQGLTDQYDEFTDKIKEDDEDDYEWNLYRFMFRKQQELNEARKARMAEILAKRAKNVSISAPTTGLPQEAPQKPTTEKRPAEPLSPPEGMAPQSSESIKKETEEIETEEDRVEQAEVTNRVPKRGVFEALMERFKVSLKQRKDALIDKILPSEEEEEEALPIDELEGELEGESKKGGLFFDWLKPFSERRQQKLIAKEMFKAATSKDSQVLLAPVSIRKSIVSRLKNGKQLLKLWNKKSNATAGEERVTQVRLSFWASLFRRNQKPKRVTSSTKAPQPTMIGRGILRAANTVNTVKNIFFKPKVEHIAVMNNAIIYPLWIKKVKDKSKRLGLMGRMKRALFGDPAIKWKPLALGWRRYAKAQDESIREVARSRNAWRRMTFQWRRLYFRVAKQLETERKRALAAPQPKNKIAALIDKASSALAPAPPPPPEIAPPPLPGAPSEEAVPPEQPPEQPQRRANVFVRAAKAVVRKAGALFTPKSDAPAAAKGETPIVQQAAEAKGPTTPPPPPTSTPPPVNPTLNTPKPQAQPQPQVGKSTGFKGFAKGVVAIPGKLVAKAKALRAQQAAAQKQMPGAAPMEQPKPRGLGALAARASMSDDEAFRRNVTEESAKVHDALGEKNMSKMQLPHRRIADALKRFFGNTSNIAQKANKDLDGVEQTVSHPRKGLLATIKSWLIKVVIGGLVVIGALAWFRTAVTSWLPRGKDGNVFHGPTLFGVRLPRFGEIILSIRSVFYMVWSPLKNLMRIVSRGVSQFMKNNEIRGASGFLRFMKQFVLGFLAGKAMGFLTGDKGGALIGCIISAFKFVPGLGQIIQLVQFGVKLASMVAGALWCAVEDIFGHKEGPTDELVDEVAKYGEAKVKELVGENRHGKAAGNVLIHKAAEIKPLVPLQNILPESMLAKNASGKLNVKALVPNLPTVNLGKGTVADEGKDINKVAKKRREDQMKESGQIGLAQVDRALANRPEPQWDVKYGEPSPEKKATLKFVNYAQKNIDVLAAAREKIKGKFDGRWSSDCWWFNDGKDPKIVWNPEWQYTGKNQEMLQSVMPPEPFGDSTKGQKYEIAKPWDHEVMGILPLGVRIPSTKAAWVVDAKMWERDRLDIGINAWEGLRDLAIKGLESGDQDQLVGGKDFIKKMNDNGGWGYYGSEDWVRISTRPNYSSRIANRRKSEMIAKWNKWNERHGNVKEKVEEIREGLQPKKPEEKKPEEKKEAAKKPGESQGSDFWRRTGQAAKMVALYGTSIGLAVVAGKKVWTLFKQKAAEKKAPKPPPPPPPYGLIYLTKVIKKEPWATLNNKKTKDEDLRKLFNIDKWFDKEPPSDEKIYKEGVGKMFYNILLAMGFKYDKAVWQNPQFLKVRPKSMQAMVASINAYVNDIIRPHGTYMAALLEWAKTHKTAEEQNAVKRAAMKEHKEIWKAISKDNFMEYVARFYIPTDIHLVVRNKEGKIVKEEGKELRGLSIPKELYDQDPAYWDYVMSLMNNSAIPPEKLIELQQTRAELLLAIQKSGKKVAGYVKALKLKRLRLKMANALADQILALRMKMLTKSAAQIQFRVDLAKKEIKQYFKYRQFLGTGSLGAFKTFIEGGNKLSKKEQKMLFGEQIEGGSKSLSEKMLGSVSEVIADRRKLLRRMRAIISAVLSRGDQAFREQTRFNFSVVQSVVKSAGITVAKVAKGAVSSAKMFVLDKVNLGIKAAKAIKKATNINLKLVDLFHKKKADDEAVKVQVEAAAKEMIPEGDKEGKERLARIVRIAQERKEEAEKEKTGLMGYWAELRRQWKDRISEESMHELQSASLKLSDNILDYLGMVREIPAGRTTLVHQEIRQTPSVIDLLPDITFC